MKGNFLKKIFGAIFILVGVAALSTFISAIISVSRQSLSQGSVVVPVLETVFAFIVMVVFLGLGIYLIQNKKTSKLNKSFYEEVKKTLDEQEEDTHPFYTCAYCQTQLNQADDRCSNCGATKK